MAEGSQDPGVKLMASQVAEYKKLKNDAEKRSASLKQKLDRVSEKLKILEPENVLCHYMFSESAYTFL